MWRKTVSQYRKRLILKRRVKHARFGTQRPDNVLIRWHGGTLAELELRWLEWSRGRFFAFVPGAYMAPRHRQRHFMRKLMTAK